MRGEYFFASVTSSVIPELPPRARRILIDSFSIEAVGGTTSACAENTLAHTHGRYHRRNYLRVRGEYVLDNLLGVNT